MDIEKSHGEIQRALGRIEGKCDAIKDRLDKLNGSVKDHDKRLDVIDKEQAIIKTKAGMVAGGISMVFVVAYEYVKSMWK